MNNKVKLTDFMFNSLLVSWIEGQCNARSISPADLDYEIIANFLTKVGTMTEHEVDMLYDQWIDDAMHQLALKKQILNQKYFC